MAHRSSARSLSRSQQESPGQAGSSGVHILPPALRTSTARRFRGLRRGRGAPCGRVTLLPRVDTPRPVDALRMANTALSRRVESCRIPTLLRDERPPAAPVPRGSPRRGHLRTSDRQLAGGDPEGRANGPDMRVVGTGWLADLHLHSLAPTSHVGADASPEPLGPVRSGNPRELSVKDGESLERLCITNPPIRRDI